MEKLKNKVAVFVGGGSAIASAALKRFIDEGASVVQVDIDDKYFERTKGLLNKFNNRIKTFIGTCTSQEDMNKAMDYTVEQFGKIDILCNFAGFHGTGCVASVRREQWDLALNVNCFGIYRATKAAFPYMKRKKYGRIMNLASIAGRANRAVPITYAASKAAAIGLTQSLATELAAYGITVNCIAPASIDTTKFKVLQEKGSIGGKIPKEALLKGPGATRGGSFIPNRPLATLDEIVHVILFLCSDDSAFLTGDCLDVNGGQFMQP